MKKLVFPLIALAMLFVSCNSDDDISEEDLVGTWRIQKMITEVRSPSSSWNDEGGHMIYSGSSSTGGTIEFQPDGEGAFGEVPFHYILSGDSLFFEFRDMRASDSDSLSVGEIFGGATRFGLQHQWGILLLQANQVLDETKEVVCSIRCKRK